MDHQHAGHRKRLKDRLMKSPIRAFPDYEVLEMLLFYAVPRADCKPLAKQLLAEFGSLRGLLNADPIELQKIPKVADNIVMF